MLILWLSIGSAEELDDISFALCRAVSKAYAVVCLPRRSRDACKVPWWNGRLVKLRKTVRKLFGRGKYSGEWREYSAALKDYINDLRRSKGRSWRELCESIKSVPIAARLQKALKGERSDLIGLLKKADGIFNQGFCNTVGFLLQTHFLVLILL